jgi:ubiquinone/menaquinone biosynthesis C-methylase UbiE
MPAGLSVDEVEAIYDRIGRAQDAQAFYEQPALEALLRHGAFEEAASVFEIGCGTGRFAHRILTRHLSETATYRAVDLSATMTAIARERLQPFGDRAVVRKTDGRLPVDRPDASTDRVVSTYVLDLLSDAGIRTVLDEAHRLLRPGGRLCLAGLTTGETALSHLTTRIWETVHRLQPAWVGGCRPVRIRKYLDDLRWEIVHHGIVSAWSVPSEVLVARPVEPSTAC